MATNQCELILEYLEEFGEGTTGDFQDILSIKNVTARISDLRTKYGVYLKTEPVPYKNRWGRRADYYKYSLPEDYVGYASKGEAGEQERIAL